VFHPPKRGATSPSALFFHPEPAYSLVYPPSLPFIQGVDSRKKIISFVISVASPPLPDASRPLHSLPSPIRPRRGTVDGRGARASPWCALAWHGAPARVGPINGRCLVPAVCSLIWYPSPSLSLPLSIRSPSPSAHGCSL
jgi:hypothetical protein